MSKKLSKEVSNIIAIDASFTRTGICCYLESGEVVLKSISRPGSNYQVDACLQHSSEIVSELKEIISKTPIRDAVLVYEYPVLASRSGAYLAVLMSKMDSLFRVLGKRGLVKTVLYVPPVAVSAYTGILMKDKTSIVKFAEGVYKGNKKYNHDVATAIILAEIGKECIRGTYKKTFYKVEL